MPNAFGELDIRIEIVDGNANRLDILMETKSLPIALAAWKQAVASYPNDRLMLMQRARIVRDSSREEDRD